MGTGYLARTERGARGYLMLYGVVAVALMLLLLLVDFSALEPDAGADAKSVLLFLAVLPPVNALFDYLSYGITLTLIRWGLQNRGRGFPFLLALLDLIAAAVMFTLLGMALVAVISLMNRATGGTMYPLGDLFEGIKAGERQYLWLYAIVFSTFFPTLIHFGLASLSLQSWVRVSWLRNRLLADYDAHGEDRLRFVLGAAGIATMWTVFFMACVGLVIGLGYALWVTFPVIGEWYYKIFLRTALWFSGGVLN